MPGAFFEVCIAICSVLLKPPIKIIRRKDLLFFAIKNYVNGSKNVLQLMMQRWRSIPNGSTKN